MNKLLFLAGIGGLAYWLYIKASTQPVAGGLPTDATLVKSMTVLGVTLDVYLSASGYYLQNNAGGKILGPYTQAQVSAALNTQSALASLAGQL